MDTTTIIIITLAELVIIGLLLAPGFSRRQRAKKLQEKFGPEYDHTVETLGDEKKALTELEERRKRVEAMNIQPLSNRDRSHFLADWTEVQTRFVDEPGEAVEDAHRLIKEVMQLRAYPVADFDQRAADISVTYPTLVENYRAARVIARKNEQKQANTEELRQAMVYYRSLFEELLGKESEVVEEKV